MSPLSENVQTLLGMLLTALVTWISGRQVKSGKDINSGFSKIRCLEKRVEELEFEIWGDNDRCFNQDRMGTPNKNPD